MKRIRVHTDTGDPQHLDAMAGLRAQAIDAIGRAHMGLLQTRLARPNESRYLDTRLLLDSVMNAGGNVTGPSDASRGLGFLLIAIRLARRVS